MSSAPGPVLVTGADGRLGRPLVAALLAEGRVVRGLDDGSAPAPGPRPTHERLTGYEADVRDRAALAAALEGADVVFHLAAWTDETACREDPVGSHAVNAEGTLAVLEAARAAGTRRVVHASTWQLEAPGAELSPFAIQKLAGEVYCRLYDRLHGVEAVSLRYFPALGPDPTSAEREAALAADGSVSLEEAVRATRRAAEAEPPAGSVVVVGGRRSAARQPERAASPRLRGFEGEP